MTSPVQEFRNLLRSRVSLFWVQTLEEVRVERALAEVHLGRPVSTSGPGAYRVRFWDCASGLTDAQTGEQVPCEDLIPDPTGGPPIAMDRSREPLGVFNAIRRGESLPVDHPLATLPPVTGNPAAFRGVSVLWVLRDLDAWLRDPQVLRGLRTLAHDLEGEQDLERVSAIVVLTASGEIPECLRDEVAVIRWPLPTREELAQVLDLTLSTNHAMVDGAREEAVDAAAGLTLRDAHNAYCYSIVASKPARIVPSVVAARKKAIVDREGVLTWFEPEPRGLDAIGGLGELKRWLEERRCALTPEARAYGLPSPRGIFLCGPPGNGKSLTAKAVASALGWPLLRLDFAALKGGIVGQSETRLRRAFEVADAVGKVVLWADELEKSLAGSQGYSGDSGVSHDQLGHFLFWLQEHSSPVFLVATSNDPTALPPELTRKGRFDEIFFVDLPGASDREDILESALRRYVKPINHDGTLEYGLDIDGAQVSRITEGFSGAEIAELVPSAMFTAFADGARPLTTADLVNAARATVPVSRSAAERIGRLREWAKTRARPAALPEAPPQPATHATQPSRPVGRLLGVESEER